MSRRGLPHPNSVSPAQAIVNPTQPDVAAASGTPSASTGERQRAKLTVQLSAELIDELRDAVVFLPTQGVQATVAGLVSQALERELVRLREEHHGGHRFPERNAEPRAGRRIGR